MIWGRPPSTGTGDPRPNVGEAALWSPWLGTGPERVPGDHAAGDRRRRPRRPTAGSGADLLLRPLASAERPGARRRRQPDLRRHFRRRWLHQVRRPANDLHLRSLQRDVDAAAHDGERALVPDPDPASGRPHDHQRRPQRRAARRSPEQDARDLQPAFHLRRPGHHRPEPGCQQELRAVSAHLHAQQRQGAVRWPAAQAHLDARHHQLHLERLPAPVAQPAVRQRRATARRPVRLRRLHHARRLRHGPAPRRQLVPSGHRDHGNDERRRCGPLLDARRVVERRPGELEHRAAARPLDGDGRRGQRLRLQRRRRRLCHLRRRPCPPGRALRPSDRQLDARAGPGGGPRLSLHGGAAARWPGRLGRGRPASPGAERHRQPDRQGGDLLTALPVQGRAAGDRLGPAGGPVG